MTARFAVVNFGSFMTALVNKKSYGHFLSCQTVSIQDRGEGSKKVLIGAGIDGFPSLGTLNCTSVTGGCAFLMLAAPVLGGPFSTESVGSLIASFSLRMI